MNTCICLCDCEVPENIHTPLPPPSPRMEGFCCCCCCCFAPLSPEEIPVKLHTLLQKFWLLRPYPPSLGISDDLPWGGYGFFFWNCRFLEDCALCHTRRCYKKKCVPCGVTTVFVVVQIVLWFESF